MRPTQLATVTLALALSAACSKGGSKPASVDEPATSDSEAEAEAEAKPEPPPPPPPPPIPAPHYAALFEDGRAFPYHITITSKGKPVETDFTCTVGKVSEYEGGIVSWLDCVTLVGKGKKKKPKAYPAQIAGGWAATADGLFRVAKLPKAGEAPELGQLEVESVPVEGPVEAEGQPPRQVRAEGDGWCVERPEAMGKDKATTVTTTLCVGPEGIASAASKIEAGGKETGSRSIVLVQ